MVSSQNLFMVFDVANVMTRSGSAECFCIYSCYVLSDP
uniref:Uncharacterized protein n=1 Tax=Arundo donax TaxID=35708 RepID=A0A0A9G0Z2_ARUDO